MSDKAEEKGSKVGALMEMYTMGRAQWTPRNYNKLAQEGYGYNPIVYACVKMVADNGARLPWALWGKEGRVREHRILEILNRPNPAQGRIEFLSDMISYLQIAGNVYVEAVTEDSLFPNELYVLRPDRMQVVLGEGGWPSGYVYQVGGQRLTLSGGEQGQVLHVRTFSPTHDYYGQSPLEAASRSVDIHNAALEFQKSLLDNAARPSGCLVYGGQGNLSQEQFSRLKEELMAHYSGVRNAGRPMLLEGGLDWRPMSLTPAEMEFVHTRNGAARDIALAFGVPPMLLGIPGDNTYANYAEALRAFTRYTLLPLMERLSGALNRWLCSRWGDESLSLALDMENIPALLPERDALWERISKADFLTLNEKRAALGYPPVS